MMTLTDKLQTLLRDQGADLVGVGDMSRVEGCKLKTGVAVAVALPRHVILDLREAPTKEYYDLYHSLNQTLNEIVLAGERFLQSEGFEAWAQTTDRVKASRSNVALIPHKTVATRAGLGWIGKNCLLVTPQYGAAVRISSLLTDAPLECAAPFDRSRCGACDICVRSCPAQALTGALWEAGLQRDAIVDVEKCHEKQAEIMVKATGIETDLCGKCFAVCAYTRKYLESQEHQK